MSNATEHIAVRDIDTGVPPDRLPVARSRAACRLEVPWRM